MTSDQIDKALPDDSLPGGAVLHIEDATVRYPAAENPALSHFNLEVKSGEFVSLLGHSGAGKTTALRVIAGFEKVQSGYVRIGGRLVASSFAHVPPDKRRVGLVFQDYALFPHLTVKANIEFGLAGMDSAQRQAQAGKMVELTGLRGLEGRYAHELSGGQQQRVALARALAPSPLVVLLDEPFSNLDRQLRSRLRREVRSILKDAGATALLVTHDREEAMALADRVGIMHEGRMEQIGRPSEVYAHPATPVVARLAGPCELVPGRIRGTEVETEAGMFTFSDADERVVDGQSVLALMRASELELAHAANGSDGPDLRIAYTEFRGEFTEFGVRLTSGRTIRVRRRSSEDYSEGDPVEVSARGESKVIVYPAD